jgi:imidazolonepropionase-like amidohydrolase
VAVEEAKASGGWCKVIADWSVGEGAERRYAPSVPPEVLAEVVRQVHAAGGRVAVHSQHHEGCAAAVAAGADSLEHGMHLATDLLDTMARQGTALVPTMLAFAAIPELLATHPGPESMRSWVASGWTRHPGLVRAAYEAGVTVLAGTDSVGGTDSPHGRVAQEIGWLARAGVPAEAALGGGSWIARRWLGLPGLEEGAPADVVAYPADPRRELALLEEPSRVILRGRVIR